MRKTINGLSAERAAALLKDHGPNEPEWRNPSWLASIALCAVKLDVCTAIFVSVAMLGWWLGNEALMQLIGVFAAARCTVEAYIRVSMMSAAVTAQRSTRGKVKTLRSDVWIDEAAENLVIGDLIQLEPHMDVPADVEVLLGSVEVARSRTGPNAAAAKLSSGSIAEMGSYILSGSSAARVVRCGMHTDFCRRAVTLGPLSTTSEASDVLSIMLELSMWGFSAAAVVSLVLLGIFSTPRTP